MSFKALPVEIVERICEYVDRRTVFGFALLSRNCRKGAASQIFHTVHLRFTSRNSFRENCDYAAIVLASPENARQVHHLEVHGFIKGESLKVQNWNTKAHTPRGDPGPFNGIFTESEDCERLFQMVVRLTSLRDLTWRFHELLPPRILRLLHKSSPSIRLHLPGFRLKSLIVSPNDPIRIDPQELELATSPCLYTLKYWDRSDAERQGLVDYNAGAVFEIMAGAAPNLRNVEVNMSPERPPYGRDWLSGTIGKDCSGLASRLQHLSISTSMHLAAGLHYSSDVDRTACLKKLRTMMDFSELLSLRIGGPLSASDVRWLAEECQFSCLHSLELELGDPYFPDQMENRLGGFLHSMPPLRSLQLSGRYLPSTVPAVLDHSGRTLQCLHLGMPQQYDDAGALSDPELWALADTELIRAIQQKAPVIADLALCIRRSAGDAKEVAIYRELGKLDSLHTLRLSVFHPVDYLWDDTRLYQELLADGDTLDESVDVVVSLAVDEALVESIWHTICSARAPHAAPLQLLEYHVDALQQACDFVSDLDWILLLAYIARSFDCTPSLRDDSQRRCDIEEFLHDPNDKRARTSLEENDRFHESVDEYCLPILQKVWPGVGSRDWMKKWHSFPLST